MAGTESSKSWEIPPELVQYFQDGGVRLPGTEAWKRLNIDLALPTESSHVLWIIPSAAQAYSDKLRNFAKEIVIRIPATYFIEWFKERKFYDLSTVKRRVLLSSWKRRTRIFRFKERVTPESLSLLNGFIGSRSPLPFIEAIWHQGHIIDLSMLGLADLEPAERSKRAMLLSAGFELLRPDFTDREITNLMAKSIKTLSGKWGGARRKPKDFTPEMCERFAAKTQELQPLWDIIIQVFEDNHYDSGCPKMVKAHSDFEKLSAVCASEVPQTLLRRVFKRKNEGGEDYWPQSFAILHAMLELGITNKYAISTLHGFYRTGNKLLKQRSEPNSLLKR